MLCYVRKSRFCELYKLWVILREEEIPTFEITHWCNGYFFCLKQHLKYGGYKKYQFLLAWSKICLDQLSTFCEKTLWRTIAMLVQITTRNRSHSVSDWQEADSLCMLADLGLFVRKIAVWSVDRRVGQKVGLGSRAPVIPEDSWEKTMKASLSLGKTEIFNSQERDFHGRFANWEFSDRLQMLSGYSCFWNRRQHCSDHFPFCGLVYPETVMIFLSLTALRSHPDISHLMFIKVLRNLNGRRLNFHDKPQKKLRLNSMNILWYCRFSGPHTTFVASTSWYWLSLLSFQKLWS
jgi:hypothetical protein